MARQADRWALWTPVAFGCGCGLYFGLRREPAVWLLVAAAAALWLAALALRRWGRAPFAGGVALLLAFAAAGVLAGKVQTIDLAGPIAPPMAGVAVEGWVVDLASRGTSGPRLLVAPTSIRGLPASLLPKRVRVTVKDDAVLGPGTPVRFTALLNPPPAPAAPGAFDFARSAYFNGIGGVGVTLRPPEVIALPPPPWRLGLQLVVNRFRWGLTRKIIDAMGQPAGGIAAAMITGHDYSIAQDATNEMRSAGISHILSISGVHMAIVGGFVFLAVRLLIACWPWLALRVNGKKWAAGAGLFAILLYLVVSGRPPPAQRSAVTASVAFGAILIDRRAISLRGLGLSALIVLLLQPEAVVEPGFQMSYAATAALVALAEVWPHARRPINTPWALRALQKAKDWLVAGVAVGLVAGAGGLGQRLTARARGRPIRRRGPRHKHSHRMPMKARPSAMFGAEDTVIIAPGALAAAWARSSMRSMPQPATPSSHPPAPKAWSTAPSARAGMITSDDSGSSRRLAGRP